MPKRWGAAERLAGLVACGPDDFTHTLAVGASRRFSSRHPPASAFPCSLYYTYFSFLLGLFRSLPVCHVSLIHTYPFCTFQISLNSAFALDAWWKKNNLNGNHLLLCAHPLDKSWHKKKKQPGFCSVCVIEVICLGKEGPTDLRKYLWWLFGDRFLNLLPNNFQSLVLKAMLLFFPGISYLWSDKRIAE